MNHLHTFSSQIHRICLRVWLILLCVGIVGAGAVHGQNTYADVQRNGTTGSGGSVTLPANAVNTNYADSTRLTASSIIGTNTAYIQLIFTGGALPANTTVFIKYKSTGALLGGGITLQAYSGSTASANGTTETTSAMALTAADGTNYIAVTSPASFNAVRVTLSSPVALGVNTADIFYAYYVPLGTGCAVPVLTAKSLTGILGVGDVTSAGNAIDGSMSTSSAFGMTLGLGSTLHQDVYFSNLSATTDAATVTLAVPASLVSVGLLGSMSITAYNNTTSVGSVTFSTLLAGTDLLTLLQSGAATTISFAPGVAFNRIEVAMSSLASVATSLNLYEVQRTPPKPSFTLPKNDTVYVCNGSTAALTANSPGAGNELRWYASALPTNTTVLHTGDTFTVPFPITQDTLFYVATGKTGCTPSSERVPVRILMKPVPGITFNSNIYTCQRSSNALLVYTTPVNSPSQYNITWGATAITANFQNVPVMAFPASPLNIAVPVMAAPNAYSGTLILTATNSCTRSYNFTLTIQASPHPPPPVTTFQ